jgi:regulator of sirC expression with transglutaminase-like and TPR domain
MTLTQSTTQTNKKHLSDSELKAFVNLLNDPEEKTLALMADQLAFFDDLSFKRIQDLTQERDDMQIIDNWLYTSKIHVTKKIKAWKQNPDLEEGLMLLARYENPGIDVEYYKSLLDTYAQRVEDKITINNSQDEVIKAINEVLFKEEKFLGNQIDYYDVNNNFINSVIDHKTGNPIMLSAIFILVARRLGVEVFGVGTPGHFIVGFRDKFYDPFFSGIEITKDECVLRAQELSVFWRDEYLDAIDDTFIVARAIRNLIAIYKKNNDLDKAAELTTLLKSL